MKTGIVNSRRDEAEEKRQRRKERTTDCQSCHSPNQDFVCALCRRDFHELACTATAGSAHCPTQLPHRLHFRPTLVPTVETCLGHGLGSIATSAPSITDVLTGVVKATVGLLLLNLSFNVFSSFCFVCSVSLT